MRFGVAVFDGWITPVLALAGLVVGGLLAVGLFLLMSFVAARQEEKFGDNPTKGQRRAGTVLMTVGILSPMILFAAVIFAAMGIGASISDGVYATNAHRLQAAVSARYGVNLTEAQAEDLIGTRVNTLANANSSNAPVGEVTLNRGGKLTQVALYRVGDQFKLYSERPLTELPVKGNN